MTFFLFQLALSSNSGGGVDIVGTGNHQIVLFWSIFIGIVVGAACALINIFTKASDSAVISFIVDLAMSLCCAAIYVFTIYLVDYGVIRTYSALSYISALIISCHFTEKIMIKTKNKIFAALKKLSAYLYKVCKVAERRNKRDTRRALKIATYKVKNAKKLEKKKAKSQKNLQIKKSKLLAKNQREKTKQQEKMQRRKKNSLKKQSNICKKQQKKRKQIIKKTKKQIEK